MKNKTTDLGVAIVVTYPFDFENDSSIRVYPNYNFKTGVSSGLIWIPKSIITTKVSKSGNYVLIKMPKWFYVKNVDKYFR